MEPCQVRGELEKILAEEDGEAPGSGSVRPTPKEEAEVMKIVTKINDGHEVWAEVTDAHHCTTDAGPDNVRIHRIEFDVFYR